MSSAKAAFSRSRAARMPSRKGSVMVDLTAIRLEIGRAASTSACLRASGEQVVGLADSPDESHVQCLLGGDPLGREQHPGGVLAAEEKWHQVGGGCLGGDAERGEGALEAGRGGHEGQVGEPEDRGTDAQPDAVDRADQRLGEGRQRVEQTEEAVSAGDEVGVGSALMHFEQVGAGAETAAASGEHHDGDRRVVRGIQEGVGRRVVERFVESVKSLGPVQGDGADPVGVTDLQRHVGQTRTCSSCGVGVVHYGRLVTSGGADPGRTRVWRPAWPCPVGGVLRQQRHGGADPTYRVDDDGRHWRGIRTPLGPATLMIRSEAGAGEVHAAAWGPGAAWALESVPDLLGARDDWNGFEARHPILIEARRRHPHARLGRSGLVLEALVPAIIEQKVTGQEAFAGFRMLVHRFGERAPGPGIELKLWVQPAAEKLRAIPSWEWLRMHIDPARSRTIVRVAGVADALERIAQVDPVEADRRLQSLPGVGEWTSAEVRQRALGDPDAVSFGDYHVAKDVGWALAGREFDDAELTDFLEPWRPQRGRVPALLGMAGLRRPRHGARMAPRTHLPARVTRT